jgi:hypothetical protein
VIAVLEMAGNANYLIATAADEVAMPERESDARGTFGRGHLST